MNETAFDKEMKEMLHQCADELHAPDKLKTRVDFELKNGSIKPRHRWGRRLVALAAVAAIAVTGAFAAGAFGSIRSSSRADQSLSMEQTQQHMEDAGASLTLPETIGDFTFSHGYDIDTTAESAMGKTEKVSEVNAEYEKEFQRAQDLYRVLRRGEQRPGAGRGAGGKRRDACLPGLALPLRSARLRAERRGKETGAPRRADHQRGLGRGRGQAVSVGKLAEGRHELFSVRL